MNDKKHVKDVFKTVGLPPYTYVKPAYYGEVRADIEQPGKHLLIEGPSGTGKTCVVYKVFEDLKWKDGLEYRYLSCRDDETDAAYLSPSQFSREYSRFFGVLRPGISPGCMRKAWAPATGSRDERSWVTQRIRQSEVQDMTRWPCSWAIGQRAATKQ